MKKFMLLSSLCFILFSCKAEKKIFQLNLIPGETYTQTTTATSTVTQSILGQELKISMEVGSGMSYTVKATMENGYDMEVMYDKVNISMNLPTGKITYNSEEDHEENIYSLLVGGLLNRPFHLHMTKNGKVSEITGIESMYDEIENNSAEKLPAGIAEGSFMQILEQVKKAYGSEALRGNLEMVTAIFPSTPVSEGDSWSVETNLNAGIAAHVTTTYTLVEITDGYLLIQGTSGIKTEDKDAYMEINGMSLKYEMEGNMSSDIKIDPVTGWIITGDILQEMSGRVYFKDNPLMPEGMSLPIEIKSETRIER